MHFLIATTGKTHCGKTTFGKALLEKIPHSCIINNDTISEFIKTHFIELYEPDFNSDGLFTQGFVLKYRIQKALFDHAYTKGLNIITSNCLITRKQRKELWERVDKEHTKFILVYFNLPEHIILKRIEHGDRGQENKEQRKQFFLNLLEKQNATFEPPQKEEADFLFEINNESDYSIVQEKIMNLIQQS